MTEAWDAFLRTIASFILQFSSNILKVCGPDREERGESEGNKTKLTIAVVG